MIKTVNYFVKLKFYLILPTRHLINVSLIYHYLLQLSEALLAPFLRQGEDGSASSPSSAATAAPPSSSSPAPPSPVPPPASPVSATPGEEPVSADQIAATFHAIRRVFGSCSTVDELLAVASRRQLSRTEALLWLSSVAHLAGEQRVPAAQVTAHPWSVDHRTPLVSRAPHTPGQ